jgi:hypothetical protein
MYAKGHEFDLHLLCKQKKSIGLYALFVTKKKYKFKIIIG